MIGTHGRTGLSRLLTGSVAESVLRNASCSVLTIKESVRPAQAAPGEAEPELDAAELRTVCSYASPLEAELVRTALRNEGIRTFLEGPIHCGVSGTLGIPVRVQVSVSDFDRVRRFVDQHESHRS